MANMTKEEVEQRIAKISAGLPKIQRRNWKGRPVASMAIVKMRGCDLIKKGTHKIDGEQVDPSKFYRLRKPLVEHHYNNLKDVYDKGGWQAVELYIRSVWRAAFMQLPFRKKMEAIYRLLLRTLRIKKTGARTTPVS